VHAVGTEGGRSNKLPPIQGRSQAWAWRRLEPPNEKLAPPNINKYMLKNFAENLYEIEDI